MIPAYQGDPKKIFTRNGTTIQVTDGDALRDQGVENAISYSLFVRDHFANVFAKNPDQVLKSNFEELHDLPVTVKNLLDIEDSARSSLKWMINNGSASIVDANTFINRHGNRQTDIIVFDNSGTASSYAVSRYDGNWRLQRTSPANERIMVPDAW